MAIKIEELKKGLDAFFGVPKLASDPSMKIFLPKVYEGYDLPIKEIFLPDFLERFNGLMVKGEEEVGTIFAASFPHKETLNKFIELSKPGDCLFLHHPIILECGDPKGTLGRGFLPIDKESLNAILHKKLSVYSCHAPLDYNTNVGTNRAIAQALESTIESEFLPYGNGNAGLILNVNPISTDKLIEKLMGIFSVPYVDFAGKKFDTVTKVGVVAGGGDDVEYFKYCESKGCQAYITGEIFSRQKSQWAKDNTLKIEESIKSLNLGLIGVSHSASEFLVMKTQFKDWAESKFGVPVVPLKQDVWWV